MLLEYLKEVGLPEILRRVREEEGNNQTTMDNLLQRHGLTKLCPSTLYNWMRRLGFINSKRKKGFYVDAHENKETQDYRRTFVT